MVICIRRHEVPNDKMEARTAAHRESHVSHHLRAAMGLDRPTDPTVML